MNRNYQKKKFFLYLIFFSCIMCWTHIRANRTTACTSFFNDDINHSNDSTINAEQYRAFLKKALTRQKVIDSLSVVLDQTYQQYYAGDDVSEKMKHKQAIRSLNKQIHSIQEEILPFYQAARHYEKIMDTSQAVAGIMTDTLRRSLFSISSVATNNKGTIQTDVSLPSGLTYRIQLGAYSNTMATSDFHGISPVMAEKIPGKPLTRYYAGLFFSYHQAKSALEKVRDKGFQDAYIVSYMDGTTIPLDRAIKIDSKRKR